MAAHSGSQHGMWLCGYSGSLATLCLLPQGVWGQQFPPITITSPGANHSLSPLFAFHFSLSHLPPLLSSSSPLLGHTVECYYWSHSPVCSLRLLGFHIANVHPLVPYWSPGCGTQGTEKERESVCARPCVRCVFSSCRMRLCVIDQIGLSSSHHLPSPLLYCTSFL